MAGKAIEHLLLVTLHCYALTRYCEVQPHFRLDLSIEAKFGGMSSSSFVQFRYIHRHRERHREVEMGSASLSWATLVVLKNSTTFISGTTT